jgi:hypothetical protein
MASKRQYHFVLSKEDEESGLKAHMDDMATQKKLTARIKTALTLLAQLENGNTEMLDTMFPTIAKKNTPPPQTPGDLQRIISDAVRTSVAEEMQKLPTLPAGRMVAEPAYKEPGRGIGATGQGDRPKKLAAVKLDLPVIIDDDDDQDTMVVTVSTGGTSNAENLMAGIFGLD